MSIHYGGNIKWREDTHRNAVASVRYVRRTVTRSRLTIDKDLTCDSPLVALHKMPKENHPVV
jgi:hypothetical protein